MQAIRSGKRGRIESDKPSQPLFWPILQPINLVTLCIAVGTTMGRLFPEIFKVIGRDT